MADKKTQVLLFKMNFMIKMKGWRDFHIMVGFAVYPQRNGNDDITL